ncbi:hypothetical protein [Nonomuraea cavernae]|uniref:hypothetical protein n=1 Tax=Nonomuraea cavernae TaxID=2045107 RepID=UPI00166BE7DB|nr:hypothetical protein [Nonomuraea cavernae]MCA2188232.1 hypothetical protein [Nonomuraea cavernae]
MGGLLGGGAVAVISGVTARDDRHVHWRHPGWGDRGGPGHQGGGPGYQECWRVPGGMYCGHGGPYPYPAYPAPTMMPRIPPTPVPTTSMMPTPVPATPVPTG